jgi:ubiquinone/menaquinone biosynthesis C-methylase UbiE
MYSESAELYDTIYLNIGKDYKVEAHRINKFIQQHKTIPGKTLLDVACGTGLHAGYLNEYYQVEGLDLNEEMLAGAREKHPGIPFHSGDMRNFDLGRQFDVVTCLFSSIGYMQDTNQMNLAIANMNRHLKPGGVMLVEPWFGPDEWNSGSLHAIFVDNPDLKIARMNISEKKGDLSYFNLHFLVGTPQGVRYFSEPHALALFTQAEYLEAFRGCGLEVIFSAEGLYGRGLYIGKKATG